MTESHLKTVLKIVRNAAFSGKVAKDVSRQHALTKQKNFHQKTAKIVVKTELESPHQKIQKWIQEVEIQK